MSDLYTLDLIDKFVLKYFYFDIKNPATCLFHYLTIKGMQFNNLYNSIRSTRIVLENHYKKCLPLK